MGNVLTRRPRPIGSGGSVCGCCSLEPNDWQMQWRKLSRWSSGAWEESRWRRREGLLGALFGGRLESLLAEQTLDWRLPRLQNTEGGFNTWAGGAPGVEGGEMAEGELGGGAGNQVVSSQGVSLVASPTTSSDDEQGGEEGRVCWVPSLEGGWKVCWPSKPWTGRGTRYEVRGTRYEVRGWRSPHPLPTCKPAGGRREGENLAGGAWRCAGDLGEFLESESFLSFHFEGSIFNHL